MQYHDYYKTLGVSRSASQEEVQKGFRKLARKYHPDTSKEPDADRRFKEINEAYEVLKDPEKRKLYDQLGSNWKAGQDFTPPPGFENVRMDFGQTGPGGFEFRFGGPGAGAGQTPGGFGGFSDFFESLFGGGGAGFGGFSDLGGGAGTRTQSRARARRPARGGDIETELTVSLQEAQAGTKKAFQLRSPDGGSKRYEVRIPTGTRDGDRLRLSGQGQSIPGGAAGDLFVRVRVASDPRFEIDGDNLMTEVKVSPWEAALGAKIDVPTLAGNVTLTVPAGTGSGRTMRLRGQGLKRMGSSEHGDLLVRIKVVVPSPLTDRERELFEALREESDFDPRQ